MELELESVGFAERARKLVSAGQPFAIKIRDPARDALRKHLVNGQVTDAPKLALTPALQPLLGILMLSAGLGRAVMFEESEAEITLRIGVGQA